LPTLYYWFRQLSHTPFHRYITTPPAFIVLPLPSLPDIAIARPLPAADYCMPIATLYYFLFIAISR